MQVSMMIHKIGSRNPARLIHYFRLGLVIDGSIAYPFNDESRVLLEIHPGDALLTANLTPD